MSEANIDFGVIVNRYGKNKEYEKQLKSELNNDNATIKGILRDSHFGPVYDSGEFTAKYSVSKSEKFDDEKLLATVKRMWSEKNGSMQCDFIRTKEYVDMDKLESAIYNGELSKEFIKEIAKCKVVTETERLNIRRNK